MNLNNLPKTTTKNPKRLGRGYGSGKGGHTSSRGQKGQRSRGGIPIWFEGGQLPQIRRFPFIKGKLRFKSLKSDVLVLSLDQLNKLPAKATVNVKTLVEAGIVTAKEASVKTLKVLGNGKIDKALTVELATTAGAKAAIEKAGGTVVLPE